MFERLKRKLGFKKYAEEAPVDEKELILSDTLSKAGTSEYAKFFLRPYNPSGLWQKKGSYDLHDEMLQDDQVGAVIDMKKHVTIATGWDIIGPEEHQEKIDFIKWNLGTRLRFGFTHNLKEMLSAYAYGYSITEKCGEVFADGPWAGKMGFRALKTRPPHGILLHTDEYGALTKITQDHVCLDPAKFVHYIHNPEFGQLYGKSDITLGVYRSWFSKNHAVKYGNIFLERFGMPVVVGSFDESATTDDQDRLQTILERIQVRTAITKPKGFQIEFPATNTTGHTTGYKNWIDMHNTMIARAMLVPDLMGMSGAKTGGGSFSLGQEHFGLFYTVIEAERTQLAMVVNRALVDKLIEWNWGPSAVGLVQFVFNPVKSADKEQFAKLWIEAVKAGVFGANPEEINKFRRDVGFPEGDVLEGKKPVADGQSAAAFTHCHCGEAHTYAQFSREKTVYEQKVNFKEMDQVLRTSSEEATKELAAIVKRSVDSMVADVRDKSVIENQNLDYAANPRFPFEKEFKTAFKGYLREMRKFGKTAARKEVRGASENAIVDDVGGLSGEQVTQLLDDTASYAAGVEWERMAAVTTPILQNGIASGASTREMMKQLDEGLRGYDIEYGAARLETTVRTNLNRTMNQGRLASFEELGDEISAYQWSSIMDGRQSDICNALDGKVYNKNEIDRIKPPAHFNCRSTLVPILKGETFKEDRLPNIETKPGGFLALAKSGQKAEGV